MRLDLELFRREVRISDEPLIRLSAIDMAPDHPRRTFIFIHGFGGQTTQWQNQLEYFSRDNRVIGLDLRGHGLSAKTAGRYTMAEMQLDLSTALQVLGVIGPIVLVGHSFGGAIAAEFAAAHPERIEALILIATAGEFELNPLYRTLLKLPLSVLRTFSPFTRNWLGAPPQVLKLFHDNTLTKWNGWALLRGLTVPTLVVRGHRDRVFQEPLFEEVTRAIPGAEEVNVGSSGHMVMLERRDAVNRAIERMLAGEQPSWREEEQRSVDETRDLLLTARPWLSHYDEGVPYTIPIPSIPMHHLLRSAVRRFPLRTAILYEGRRLTYRRLNREANRFANALRSLGLDNGDRVMLLLPNTPQLVIGFFGTLKSGGVAVFTLPTTDKDELIRQIRESGARVLVTLNQFGDLAQQAQAETDLEHVIFTSVTSYMLLFKRIGAWLTPSVRKSYQLSIPLRKGMHRFQRLIYRYPTRAPQIVVSPHDLAVIIFTGGTTATPKGVMLTHRNLVANALQTRHWIPDAKEGKEVFVCVLPFTHSYGLTTALNVPIALAATLIVKPKFDVHETLQAIKKYRPTIFPGVPNMYLAIKDYPGVRKYKISSIRACISGAAPLPVEVQESFEKLTRGRLVEGYGLTETSPVTHANPLSGLRKIGSIGIPLPSTEARVVDLVKGQRVKKTGQIGELAIRGPQVMAGYYGDPEGTHAVLSKDGWLLTGDVVQEDAQGYFRLIARKADMWYPDKPEKPAFPRDVEEVIFEIPQVKEVAVIAIANQPIAFLLTHGERPTAESIRSYCRRRLPPELVPRLVIYLDEFPRSFVGKILRRELAKRYEQQQLQA
jgi:long-chain acyl-CoA synthetase